MGGLIRIVLVFAFVGGAYAALRSNYLAPAAAPATTARTASAATATPRNAAAAPTVSTVPVRPTPAAFALTMSDADLTKAASGSFPQTVNGITVREPNVSIETAGVRLTAKAQVFFGTTQFVMTATPVVTDGRITVRVDTATLAGLALPDSTRASIADTVQGTIATLVPSSVRVTTVSFAPGTLTVQGTQP
ncbi:MAG TPA: hypothetical protein VGK15_02185 [Candidatus Limnocylindria bacterium]|jgi:hypothetical protein